VTARPGPVRGVEAEANSEHPEEEAGGGRGQGGGQAIDSGTDGGDRDRGPEEGGHGLEPAAQHGRDLTNQDVAQGPAAYPGDSAEDHRLPDAEPEVQALLAPVTVNTLSPTASSTVIGPDSRSSR